MIILQPYLPSRRFAFCPSDRTTPSSVLATDLNAYNGNITDSSLIIYAERNSEALNASDNAEYGYVGQDDFDAWVGESALVQWGADKYGNEGWIRYNRPSGSGAGDARTRESFRDAQAASARAGGNGSWISAIACWG